MRRLGVVIGLVVTLSGAACGGGSTATAGRDKCEAQYGVGNCVERGGKWVPLASAVTSTTTAPLATPTTYDKGQSLALKAYCQAEFKVDSCVYDRNRGEWVPAADAQRRP